jgi:hypothetical protein
MKGIGAMSTIDIAFVTLVLMAFAGFAVVLAYFSNQKGD